MFDLSRYRAILSDYVSKVRIPAPEESAASSLQEIFVEPRVLSPEQHRRRRRFDSSGGTNARGPVRPDTELALQAIRRSKLTVILGEPGSGKSTLLREYARCLAEDKRTPLRFHIFAELSLAPQEIMVSTERLEWLHQRIPGVARAELGTDGWQHAIKAIRDGKASLLLDGYDEVTAGAQEQLSAFLSTSELQMNDVVVTSRPHAYRLRPIHSFSTYNLTPFELDKTEELAEKSCAAVARGLSSHDFEPALNKVRQIARGPATAMTRNPLLLSFLCWTALRRQREGTLANFANRPVTLILDCIDALVWWNRNKTAGTWRHDLLTVDVIRILAPRALESYKNGSTLFELSSSAEQEQKDNEDILCSLKNARFVEQRGRAWGFPLEAFRAYFAAVAVAASTDPFTEIKRYLHNPRWQEVLVYAAGILTEANASRIDLAAPRLVSRLVKWGPSVLGAFVKSLPPRPPGSSDGLEELLANCVEVLQPFAQEPLDRWLARSRGSIEFFITSILQHPSAHEDILARNLRVAARCLGNVAHCPETTARRVTSALISYALQNNHSPVFSVFQALLDEASVCPAVRAYLVEMTNEGYPQSRGLAISALRSACNDPDIKRRLLDLTQDQSANVRSASARAVSPLVFDAEVKERLFAMTDDPVSFVCGAAIDGLRGVAAEPAVVQRLLELMRARRSIDLTERDLAEQILREIAAQPDVCQMLLEKSKSENSLIRWAVAAALQGAVEAPEVRARLLKMMRDPDSYVRLNAANSLKEHVSDPRVWKQLLRMMPREPQDFQDCYIEFLKDAASQPPVRELLLKAAYADEVNIRVSGIKALTKIASDPEIQQRLLLLTDSEPYVAEAAVIALSPVVSESKVRERMVALTFRTEPHVRTSAIRALRDVAWEPSVQQRLVQLLHEPGQGSGGLDRWVKESVVAALQGWTGKVTSLIGPLVRLAERDASVRPDLAWETLDILLPTMESEGTADKNRAVVR